MCGRNNPADIKIRGEGGARAAPGARAEIPLKPVESLHWSRFSGKSCGLWRSHTGLLDEVI